MLMPMAAAASQSCPGDVTVAPLANGMVDVFLQIGWHGTHGSGKFGNARLPATPAARDWRIFFGSWLKK